MEARRAGRAARTLRSAPALAGERDFRSLLRIGFPLSAWTSSEGSVKGFSQK